MSGEVEPRRSLSERLLRAGIVPDTDHPQLERLGVQLRSRDDLHRFFRPFAERRRDVHVHACPVNSSLEREHLLFRDYMRVNRAASEAYVKAKRQAARIWSDDGWAYTDAKTEVILKLLDEAELWALDRYWRP